jgi:hypothetical protein
VTETNSYGLAASLDDELYHAMLDTVGGELAFAATDAACRVIAARRDAIRDQRDNPPLNWLLGWNLEAL